MELPLLAVSGRRPRLLRLGEPIAQPYPLPPRLRLRLRRLLVATQPGRLFVQVNLVLAFWTRRGFGSASVRTH
uniref:Uncharacterized protein n=1 Tax=Oryza glumipatula TaxID=40148 RepID=A0A0E0AR25_9ORYZ